MFRKLTVLAFSVFVTLAGMAAATTPSQAGHRDGVRFSIGVGSSGHVRFGRHVRPRFHHPRARYHHSRPYRYRHYDYDYQVPLFRHYPPVVYHQPRIRYHSGGSHVGWCYSRYRSYRAYDNTFQPYHGRRRQCWSPYS